MVPTAMFASFGLATPAVASRLGLERTAAAAMLMAGVGMLAAPWSPTSSPCWRCPRSRFAGMGIGNVVIPPLVKRYFSDRVAVMSSLYIVLVQLGTVLPALSPCRSPTPRAGASRSGCGRSSRFAAAVPWLWIMRERPRPGRAATPWTSGRRPHGRPGGPRSVWGMAGMFGDDLADHVLDVHLDPDDPRPTPARAQAFGGAMVGLFAAGRIVAALGGPRTVRADARTRSRSCRVRGLLRDRLSPACCSPR